MDLGAKNTRPLAKAGAGPGPRSCRSMRFLAMSGGFYTLRMRSTSLCSATCYAGAAQATAGQRVGLEDASPTAQPSMPLLAGDACALFCIAAPLPSANKPLIGVFGMAGEFDLAIAQLLDVVCIGGAALVAFPGR